MMKQFCLCLVAAAITCSAAARDVAGRWVGTLKVPGAELTLVFRIQTDFEGRFSALLDSPDQGAKDIPCDSVTFADPQLTIVLNAIGARYEAILSGDTLRGTFTQSGMSFPLMLTPAAEEDRTTLRPQEPRKPYLYLTEEVRFSNPTDGDTLAGTLTLPATPGPHAAVVLITGSGPQDRDESLMNHKPFLIWADALTRRGIAVLRYDDRGVGASTGDFSTATTVDFSRDTEAALDYLRSRPKDIDPRRIGLMGHSEGGLIAPMVAARRPEAVAFVVLLAAPGVRGDSLLMMQREALIGAARGVPDSVQQVNLRIDEEVYALLRSADDNTDSLRSTLAACFRSAMESHPGLGNIPPEQREGAIAGYVAQLTSPWMRAFVRYEPQPTLRRVTCPVLAVNGRQDVQVLAEANLSAIRHALEAGGNRHVRTLELPGLNHLFQHCVTCTPDEYSRIRQTVAPEVLRTVIDWIVENNK